MPPIQADEKALYRALVNLVANALEAVPEGGRLTLRLGWNEGGDPPARIRRAFNRRVKIEVEDSGTGIPASSTDRIFTPFFTTKATGTGLGAGHHAQDRAEPRRLRTRRPPGDGAR